MKRFINCTIWNQSKANATKATSNNSSFSWMKRSMIDPAEKHRVTDVAVADVGVTTRASCYDNSDEESISDCSAASSSSRSVNSKQSIPQTINKDKAVSMTTYHKKKTSLHHSQAARVQL